MVRTCEVALPLPLRTTFTYRVPEALDEAIVDGARVVVPFRNRAMLGVVLGRGDTPDGASLKDVTEIIDPLPALSPRLIELARWISNYYLSPIGETLRAMLPPSVEVQFDREWQISEAGHARLRELRSLAASRVRVNLPISRYCRNWIRVAALSLTGFSVNYRAARLRRRGFCEGAN